MYMPNFFKVKKPLHQKMVKCANSQARLYCLQRMEIYCHALKILQNFKVLQKKQRFIKFLIIHEMLNNFIFSFKTGTYKPRNKNKRYHEFFFTSRRSFDPLIATLTNALFIEWHHEVIHIFLI